MSPEPFKRLWSPVASVAGRQKLLGLEACGLGVWGFRLLIWVLRIPENLGYSGNWNLA